MVIEYVCNPETTSQWFFGALRVYTIAMTVLLFMMFTINLFVFTALKAHTCCCHVAQKQP